MADLTSRALIVAKGGMFAGIAAMCTFLLIDQSPTPKTGALLAVLVWSACRFYYFTFYVLEKYVDPTLKYTGLWNLVAATVRRRRQVRRGA